MTMKLSDKFSTGKLLLFSLPSIAMMIFTSIYGVVDGFFVSNFAGKTAFAAVNFIMPVIMIMCTPGFMIGTGGSALVAKTLGEQDPERARRQFSLLVIFAIALGLVLMAAGWFGMESILRLLGCSEAMMPDARLYGQTLSLTLPLYLLQTMFQAFYITAEKPSYGFYVTLACGLTNMILDYVFIGVLGWGVAGAAWATNLGICIGGIVPLIYFARKRSSVLYFTKTSYNGRVLLQTCSNGFSELLTNVSMSLVSILYNWQLLRFIGEDGVSAYGVLMYVNMIFAAVFMGFTIGTAPILSYNLGAGNKQELSRLLHRSMGIILSFSALMWLAAEMLGSPLAHIFVGYDEALLHITEHAFSIYSYGFLFMGMAVYGSGFFTALNDGMDSALISFFRTLVFQVAAVLILPEIFGVEGIWWSIVLAELAAFTLVFFFLYLRRRRFGYTVFPERSRRLQVE